MDQQVVEKTLEPNMESQVATLKIQVEVPKELSQKLQKICMATGEQPKKIMTEALARYFGKPIPKEERFFTGKGGRKWAIPKNTFIVFALPQEEWRKLRKWRRKNGDHLFFDTMSDNEVLIVNETKLEKRRARKREKPTQNIA